MRAFYRIFLVCLVALPVVSPAPVYADAISPRIKDKGKLYSEEAPDAQWYGTGPGAAMTEASMLRFQCERALHQGQFDKAIAMARKCSQLDPTDPTNHLLLARGLTKKLFSKPGQPYDEKILEECIYEWVMIARHDADHFEQVEARGNLRKLNGLAKALRKEKQEKAKQEQIARKEAKEALARDRETRIDSAVAEVNAEIKETATKQVAQDKATPSSQVAVKKRRFWLF